MSGGNPIEVGMAGPEALADARRRPWLAACAGWFAAGALASLAAWACGLEPSRIVLPGTLGAIAGGVAGPAVVGWALGVLDRRRGAASGRPIRADLWDPWLDEGGGADAITPARAPVRPRVFSKEGGSFCLEDEVHPFAKKGECGAIRIEGPGGSGKSTALRHLLAVLPPELGVRVLDGPDAATLADQSRAGLVVYAAGAPASAEELAGHLLVAAGVDPAHVQAPTKDLATYRLASWGEDERIEYLLNVAGGRCKSVMGRLEAADDDTLAGGSPELWRVVLDRMIADDSIAGVRQALRRDLAERLRDGAIRERVLDHCLGKMDVPMASPPDPVEQDAWRSCDPTLHRLIRHRPVQVLLAADRVVADLARADAPCSFLARRLPRDLVREAGPLIHDRPEIAARLASAFAGGDRKSDAMAASLLHAAGLRWRPAQGSAPRLSRAYLAGVDWPGIALPSAELIGVEMDGARLPKAALDNARLDHARLGRARLGGASLRGVSALLADLRDADLSSTLADGALFIAAHLERALLESASLRGASFQQANLTGARLGRADLAGANLEGATIDGADFSGASLESAILRGLPLAWAALAGGKFTGASFDGADLSGCNLEGMELPGAIFPNARLADALLTGSILPKANLRKADLRGAGLAEVAWEGARLVGADLRGASFHLGSSRSGLVDSPIASEGSRTGFYTDDFDDQDFKPPEEIRKADLRGVDLTGANLEGVDFYLVDLRGATLDPSQAAHARRTGAILRDRRG